MKHIAIFNTSGDVQTALDEQTLLNPYVALVSGSLDYNSIQPVGPCYLGEWSNDGAGHYTFHINDTGDTAWTIGVNIGQLMGVYFNGDQLNMNVKLESPLSEPNNWNLYFEGAGDPSESPNYQFNEGSSETWEATDVTTDGDSSTASVDVEWNGTDTFEFYQMASDAPALSMSTINPECSE